MDAELKNFIYLLIGHLLFLRKKLRSDILLVVDDAYFEYVKQKDYLSGLDFLNKIALLAEEEDHHPEIILEWGKVTVSWWSHKIKGLHKNDFIAAAKTDSLFSE